MYKIIKIKELHEKTDPWFPTWLYTVVHLKWARRLITKNLGLIHKVAAGEIKGKFADDIYLAVSIIRVLDCSNGYLKSPAVRVL